MTTAFPVSAKGFDPAASRLAIIALLLAIAAISSIVHWQALKGRYFHPDEEIARAVVAKVLATKSKDTNWAHTDVDEMFRYDQYNFSSYYLFAAKIERVLKHRAKDIASESVLLENLRRQNVILGGLTVLLAGLFAWRLSNSLGALMGAILTACNVTLFQDTLYARPETFVTVLTLVFVLLQISRRLNCWMVLALSGFVLGVLIAAKITFLLFLPFPLLAVAAGLHARHHAYALPEPWRIAAAVALYCGGMLAGFKLGAPYALKAPWEYLTGISFLVKQYNGHGWWPYTLGEAGLFTRLANGTAYLAYTMGWPAFILSFAGILSLWRDRRHVALFAVIGPLLTLLYFIQAQTFFERNFSHALPIMLVLSALGFVSLCRSIRAALQRHHMRPAMWQPALAGVAAVVTVFPSYSVSASLQHALFDKDREKRLDAMEEQASFHHSLPVLFAWADTAEIAAQRGFFCGEVIHRIYYFDDLPSQHVLANLLADGYRIEQRFASEFDGSPGSTLQSIHSPGFLFLRSPPDRSDIACKADLLALKEVNSADYKLVDTSIQMSPFSPVKEFHPDHPPSEWNLPLYASGNASDSNVGELQIGPFKACGDVVVPYALGPAHGETKMSIERSVAGTQEVITEGRPPPATSWTGIHIRAAASCAEYTIRAQSEGRRRGQWIAVGMPVELRAANQPIDAGNAPAAVRSTTAKPQKHRDRGSSSNGGLAATHGQ